MITIEIKQKFTQPWDMAEELRERVAGMVPNADVTVHWDSSDEVNATTQDIPTGPYVLVEEPSVANWFFHSDSRPTPYRIGRIDDNGVIILIRDYPAMEKVDDAKRLVNALNVAELMDQGNLSF